jgi:hypothetical protein
MSSVPDGRAANQLFAVTTLMPPIGASLPGARSSTPSIFASQLRDANLLARKFR